jgi:hypothetical protein
MTETEKMDFATEVFVALVTEKQDRLTKGLMLRQAMHDQIKRGETPSGYRPAWLKAQSLAVVKSLAEAAEAFDQGHPDDKASVSDLMDILATAMNLFRKNTHD